MNALLEEIYRTSTVEDAAGQRLNPFPVATPKETGQLFYNLIKARKLSRTLEVGMAYGLSTVFICQAHRDNGGGAHVAIDPSQTGQWKSIGLLNLERAGLKHYCEWMEAFSHDALPQLLSKKQQLDFAYIDGMHLFDFALLDFFYVDRMLQAGGLVAFDDIWMPAIRRLINYVLTNRNYERLNVKVEVPFSDHAKASLRRLSQAPFEFDPAGLRFAAGNVCVLRKIADDERSWTFHKAF